MELTTYEKELCKPNNMMLAGIILSSINEDGYYISKSNEKVYTLTLTDGLGRANLITTAMREEDGELFGYGAQFISDALILGSMYENHPELLPQECPTIIDYESIKQVPLVVTYFGMDRTVNFVYKGKHYETTLLPKFDVTDPEWWANFAIEIYMQMEDKTLLPE